MARIGQTCPGDCSNCDLLAEGYVEMVPCILDQIFQRVRKNESVLEALSARLSSDTGLPRLADVGVNINKEKE